MNNQVDNHMLYKSGFTPAEIERLSELRKNALLRETHITPADYRRLDFVRWLVTTDRMTEQIA